MSQSVPDWAAKKFSERQSKMVEDKITEIETSTKAEVVVVVAERSSTLGHVPFLLYLSLLLIFTLVDLPHIQSSLSGDLWWPILLWPIVTLILTRILSSSDMVKRLFLPKEDRLSQVEQRAEIAFYRNGLKKTDGSTGILLFVSLFEHQAVILGDQSISQKLPPDTWAQILSDFTNEAKKGKVSDGIVAALNDMAPILKTHFPAQEKNPNELPNHLIFAKA